MIEKILNQIFNKCVTELQKEDTILYVEKEIVNPIINRYTSKMQNTLVKIYAMYSVIILLLIVIIIILIILITKRINYS